MAAFGDFLKKCRIAKRVTLREFCKNNEIDQGNYSRMERGKCSPPKDRKIIEKYANALGLTRDSDEWLELFDYAAAERGEVPADLMSDEQLCHKLPVLFRTMRNDKVTPEKLDEFIELIRRS